MSQERCRISIVCLSLQSQPQSTPNPLYSFISADSDDRSHLKHRKYPILTLSVCVSGVQWHSVRVKDGGIPAALLIVDILGHKAEIKLGVGIEVIKQAYITAVSKFQERRSTGKDEPQDESSL
jgi:hypothetical protein